MSVRSTSAQVRNPIAADSEVAKIIAAMSPEGRESLRKILKALSASWRSKADKAWRTHKPPMAAYWKAGAVNARHLSVALKSAAPRK